MRRVRGPRVKANMEHSRCSSWIESYQDEFVSTLESKPLFRRIENQDVEAFTSASARDAKTQEDLSLKSHQPKKARRNASGGPTVQTLKRVDKENSFQATQNDYFLHSVLVGENSANKQIDGLITEDKEQSPAEFSISTETSSTLMCSSVATENQLRATAEILSLKSADKPSAAGKRFSRRTSSVGARGSPETNSLICYIAKRRMQSQGSQKIALLKSKMIGFMDVLQISDHVERKMSTPELLHPPLQQDVTSSPAQRDSLCLSESKASLKKKVTFGEELSPEVFDKRLPSNTPLRKGETPVCRKGLLSEGPTSALKQVSVVQINLGDETNPFSNMACSGNASVNEKCNNISLKLVTKLTDNMENAETHLGNEQRDCSGPINVELQSSVSECKLDSKLEKKSRKNYEYPCDVLEMHVEEIEQVMQDHPPRHSRKENQVGDNNVVCRDVPGAKQTDSVNESKLSRRIEPKYFGSISDLGSSEGKAASTIEPNVQQVTCMCDEKLKNGDIQFSDLSINGSINDQEQNRSCAEDACLEIQNVTDDAMCLTMSSVPSLSRSVEVSPKSNLEVKIENLTQTPKNEEPRRSSRIKNKVNTASENSTVVTKGKYRKKVQKELYGKREYASKKPLLSPITEVFDMLSEPADFPDCDGKAECKPSAMSVHLPLEAGSLIGEQRQHSTSDSEWSADGHTALRAASRHVREKIRRPTRSHKRSFHDLEGESSGWKSSETDSEQRTILADNVSVHRCEPEKLKNNLSCGLSSRADESSTFLHAKFHKLEALDSLGAQNLEDDENKPICMRETYSNSIMRKHLVQEFTMVKNNEKGIDRVQILLERQCPSETKLEQCIKEAVQTADYKCRCCLESESNVVQDRDQQLKAQPAKMEELTVAYNFTRSKESRKTATEPSNAIHEQKVSHLPCATQIFQSRTCRRKSKLFRAAELACEKQVDEPIVVHSGGQETFTNDNKAENVSQAESLVNSMIGQGIVPKCKNNIEFDEIQVKTNVGTLFDNSGHFCSSEQMNMNTLETADQLEMGIKCLGTSRENSILEKKKVRRSARLSGVVNVAGLSWVELSSTEPVEEKMMMSKLPRRSSRLSKPWTKIYYAEEAGSKTESQARIRMLRRRSLSCLRNTALDDLEESPRQSVVELS
ncbi:cell division cycle-associated protein 2 isoform X2 [Stegostoma tigrinum]|uniref:cell division cycle-associated protein 2 isoform X2 n=1 Tax=Stegostoma tigrinum TaxID=3053191 RepID=UPI00202B23E7|nr:cell division cycle-associated protein 2 isoform X2 [Stegostoma tigrinum]